MKQQLRISDDLQLPLETVTSTLIVYGGKGMGKTNFGSVLAEELSATRQRFAGIDPMGVMWGLRHSADGKGLGIEVLVLGGRHGDIPIEPTAGAVVADLVADEEVDVIIDIKCDAAGKTWSLGQRIRFVADFTERLHERQGERARPLMLIIDEAGRFCPQVIPHGSPDVARCCGAVERLVEEGRNVGIGVTLITQRSARMNKSVSELADCMVAFRTVGPRSVTAILDWFGEHVAKERWNGLSEKLRKLDRGTALVVSPGWLDFEGTARIRARRTFDSSSTPSGGRARAPSKGATPDLGRYQERMRETIERASAENPKALRAALAEAQREPEKLRAEIVRLEAEAATRLPAWHGLAFSELRETNVLRCTSKRGYNQALDDWTPLEWAGAAAGELGEMANLVKKMRRGETIPVGDVADEIADVVIYLDLLAALLKVDLGEAVVTKFNKTSDKGRIDIKLHAPLDGFFPTGPLPGARQRHLPRPKLIPPPRPEMRLQPSIEASTVSQLDRLHETHKRELRATARSDSEPSLRGGARRMLTNLVAMGPLTKTQLATLSVMAPSSGTFSTYISNLRTGGLIEDSGDGFAATKSGRALIGPVSAPSTAEELRALWSSKLRGGARNMLAELIAHGKSGLHRDTLADRVGMEPTSGTFSTYLSNLTSNGLAVKSREGRVTISDVFSLGRRR